MTHENGVKIFKSTEEIRHEKQIIPNWNWQHTTSINAKEMAHKYLKMLNGSKRIQFVCYKCQRDGF